MAAIDFHDKQAGQSLRRAGHGVADTWSRLPLFLKKSSRQAIHAPPL
jgi:hypothetical protein